MSRLISRSIFFCVLGLFSHLVAAAPTDNLTEREKKILEVGKIDQGRRAAGYALGYTIGFGLGHAIVKKWPEQGWIFTVGDTVTLGALIAGAIERHRDGGNNALGNTLIGVGILGFLAFRTWEIVDLAYRPHQHNEEYDRIQEKVVRQKVQFQLLPTIASSGLGLMAETRF